jgi:hypothetical protein
MLRDVVIHLHNEQPILADLFEEPSTRDFCLICTNLRTMNGKAPVFVSDGRSTFMFPLAHVRFVEIRTRTSADVSADAADDAAADTAADEADAAAEAAEAAEVAEALSQPTQRLKSGNNGDGPLPHEGLVPEAPIPLEMDDGELLRRVRDA